MAVFARRLKNLAVRRSFTVLLVREPASFWRENVIAIVILLRVVWRMSQ